MDPSNEFEAKFYEEMKSKVKLVQSYENLNLLEYAADLIPIEDLNVKATLKLSLLEAKDDSIRLEEVLLLELLNWFKCSFFTWVDIPQCDICFQTPQKKGIVPPEETESIWGASRVEKYFCPQCQKDIRFPRYNHPRKLLETRRGRCGEWANCFTFLCRALGYDARLVMDWTDHVWTEVFSFTKSRWLHCDPCENICDKPLIYEMGWKKDITYIIAFSKDEVQDVTWRYTAKFNEVLNRRNLCREEWLLKCIMLFTEQLQDKVSLERKVELTRRRVLELVEFLTPPKADGIFGGRSSGSLAWRIARGEVSLAITQSAYVFILTSEEIQNKRFHIKYSCATDKYVRVSNKFSEKENWASCTHGHRNIFRKVEDDWKMVYLARTEGAFKGLITWKFNFKESGLVIQTIKLNLKTTTFESGKIRWLIFSNCEESIPKIYEAKEITRLQTREFKGSTGLIISAELSEGTGNVSWQHAQLFRQSLDSNEFPFEVEITLDRIISIL